MANSTASTAIAGSTTALGGMSKKPAQRSRPALTCQRAIGAGGVERPATSAGDVRAAARAGAQQAAMVATTPTSIALDGAGNVFVAGGFSHNVFKITPGGTITEIIDSSGDGLGNALTLTWGVATDSSGNVYVSGVVSDNVFKITPGGTITLILDATGDGLGNTLWGPSGLAVDPRKSQFRSSIPSPSSPP